MHFILFLLNPLVSMLRIYLCFLFLSLFPFYYFPLALAISLLPLLTCSIALLIFIMYFAVSLPTLPLFLLLLISCCSYFDLSHLLSCCFLLHFPLSFSLDFSLLHSYLAPPVLFFLFCSFPLSLLLILSWSFPFTTFLLLF